MLESLVLQVGAAHLDWTGFVQQLQGAPGLYITPRVYGKSGLSVEYSPLEQLH
jgi:hypothetical protein